jgi:hypothetical protein
MSKMSEACTFLAKSETDELKNAMLVLSLVIKLFSWALFSVLVKFKIYTSETGSASLMLY